MSERRIIKTSQVIPLEPVAQVVNTNSASQSNTYSCNYINQLIDSGSNANGSYIKFPDGTMICNGTKYFANTSDAWQVQTFPVSFILEPNVIATLNTGIGQSSTVASAKVSKISTTNFEVCLVSSSGYGTGNAEWMAIGKWK